MDNNAKDTFAFDLENRLDDFFSDSEPPPDAAPELEDDFILKDLKSAVLAIDWEITDDALDDFITQLHNLEEPFEKDKVNQTFLKIQIALAKYLRLHKSKAHPDAIKCVMAVYSALEKAVTETELSQGEKEEMLAEQVKRFKQLKAMIFQSKSATSKASDEGPSSKKLPDMDKLIDAIADLKSTVLQEIAAIRKEIEQLQK